MRFPEYTEYAPSDMSPIDGYIQYVGARYASEPFVTDQKDDHLQAAILFAEGCRQATVNDNPRKAKPLFLEARRVLGNTEEEINEADGLPRCIGFAALLKAATFRNQPSAVKAAREELHHETMEALRQEMDQYDFLFKNEENSSRALNRLRHSRGRVNHLCVTGLFTHLGNHPWIGAWPALTFHAGSSEDVSRNADAIVTETTPELTVPSAYPVQVVSRCLGFCGKPPSTPARTKYDPSVVLVSGECDLYVTKVKGKDIFPTAHLLLGEYDEQLDTDQTALLDRIGNELRHSITVENEGRRGLYNHEVY